MRKKAYGFKVAGQTNQGSARLAILGREYVTTKRLVNLDLDRSNGSMFKASMKVALNAFSEDEIKAFATKGDYKPGPTQKMKATAMPLNFYAGSGYGV